VVAVHATGFCKETWDPVAAYLGERAFVALDLRAHGDSATPEPPFDWWDAVGDVLAVIAAAGLSSPVGLGHSSGAAALVMAEVRRPGTFSSLVLVEPIIFPGPRRRMEDNPMSSVALRRRRAFPSREATEQSFSGRRPFTRWVPAALRAYVEHGFADRDGIRVLKCSPEAEAEYYRGAADHGAWDLMGEVTCPVVLVAGEDSESHPEDFARRQAEQFPEARLEVVAGATHLVPMEQPEAVAAIVESVAGAGR